MSFGTYFKELRNKKKKTQNDIAKAINKSNMLISGVENSKNGPFSEEDLYKISECLELSEAEKNQLFIEAAIERGRIPETIASYMKDYKMAYVLLYTLSKKRFTDKDISNLIDRLEEK